MNIYTIKDASGVAHDLAPGVVVTSYVQRIDTPEEAEAFGAAVGAYVPCEVQIAYSLLDGYSDDLLARWNIFREVVADPEPPAPPRPELPKSTVIARLDGIDKLNAVWTILNAMPVLFAKWFSPDWPNVYCDDPGMLQVFQAAGLTADEIATVTA